MDTDVDGRASTSLSSSSSSSLWLLQSDNGPNTRLFIPDGGHGLGDGGMVDKECVGRSEMAKLSVTISIDFQWNHNHHYPHGHRLSGIP